MREPCVKASNKKNTSTKKVASAANKAADKQNRFTSEEFQVWKSNNLTRIQHLQEMNKSRIHHTPTPDEVFVKVKAKFGKKKKDDLLR